MTLSSLDLSDTRTSVPDAPTATPIPSLLRPIEGSPGHFLLILDNSSIERFVTCPRSAEYYLLYQREAHAKNAALTFGGAIHVGIESLLRGEPLPVAQQKMRGYFTSHPSPPDEYRTPNIADKVLEHYAERSSFPDYHWTILSDPSSGEPLIERAFQLPLGVIECPPETFLQLPQWPEPQLITHIHVAWSGRMDVVVAANGNRVADHKTTSIAGDQFIHDFQLSNQTIGYVWAGRQLYPELNITGFIGNAIHLKRPAKGGFAPGASLLERGPRGGEPPLSFFRFYFDYSPERVAEWQDNIMTIMEDFVRNLVRNFFPMHTKWCFGKYGKCPYHDVCTLDDKAVRQRLLMADSMYRQVTWDPTSDR